MAQWTGRLEAITLGSGTRISRGSSAYYFPDTHEIEIGNPPRGRKALGAWSRDLLHELGHASARRTRRSVPRGTHDLLGSGSSRRTLSKGRAREEIVAELVSYKISKRLGIPKRAATNPDRARNYVRDWRQAGYERRDRGRKPAARSGYRSKQEAATLMADVDFAVDTLMEPVTGRKAKRRTVRAAPATKKKAAATKKAAPKKRKTTRRRKASGTTTRRRRRTTRKSLARARPQVGGGN